VIGACGCQRSPVDPPHAAAESRAARFDPKTAGTIAGRVLWDGDLPNVQPVRYMGLDKTVPDAIPNPHRPTIDAKSRAIAAALVHLKKVDPAVAAPWKLPPASAVFTDKDLEVRQGPDKTPIGLVRKGDDLACSTTAKGSFLLIGRGNAFFSLPFVEPGHVTRRRLENAGHVELTCGRGRYWLRGHVWVSEHPYVALTKVDGSFTLEQVPAGEYELAVWLPNWNVLREERNAETGEVERLLFQPPLERSQSVTVAADKQSTSDIRLNVAAK
jgi:hypothetical protein